MKYPIGKWQKPLYICHRLILGTQDQPRDGFLHRVITELRCCLSFQPNLHSKNTQNHKHKDLTGKYQQLLRWNCQDWPPNINVKSSMTCTPLISSWMKNGGNWTFHEHSNRNSLSGMLPSPPIVNWGNDQLLIYLCGKICLSCGFSF